MARRSTLHSPPSTMNPRHLLRSTLLVAFFFGLDKVIALGRQVIVGRVYGVGPALDAYNAANNLPDLLVAVISGGALAIAFIPVLSEYLDREGREEAWLLFSQVANAAFLVTAVLAVLIAIFAAPIVSTQIVPKFPADRQALVVSLMRVNLIATLIFSLSGLVIGALQANQHFWLPALAPILYNVGQIIGVLFLAPRFGIYGLAYGVILGAVLHLAVQVPGLIRYGFRYSPRLDWRHPGLRRVALLMGPRVLTLAALQYIFVSTDRLASGLPEGAITALAYGWLIMQVPETIVGTAVGTALLPTLSELVARKDDAGLRGALSGAIRALLAFTLPAAIALIVLIRPLVQAVFEGRAFTSAGTSLVAFAAQMFLVGLVGHSLVEVAARTFYARQDARTPLIAAWGTLGLFLVLCYALIPSLGHGGIALANSIAFTTEGLVLILILQWRHADLDLPVIGGSLWRIGAATLPMGLAIAAFAWFLRSASPLLLGAGGLLVAALVYLPLAFAILPEFRRLPQMLVTKIG
ncbi:MAG: murein biosynthesis integral membrane protein MurJ [Chloroflexi bacterium]|nr:murein biosynthesis integral membrane protein MurJ [Chloroflexota bacterium]